MRSRDVWFGVSYYIPFFTVLQELMMVHLQNMDYEKFEGLALGPFYLHAGSLHLYDRNIKEAIQLISDPIGYFHSLEGEMPPITFETLKELPRFLKFEKEHRRKKQFAIGIEDDFLDTLVNYLCSEDNI